MPQAVSAKIILARLRYFSRKPCRWRRFTSKPTKSGTTKLIKGFKGKKGNSFDAAVAFDDEFNVTLAFPDKKRGKKR